MEWLFVSIRPHTRKLRCSEAARGFWRERLKENDYLALTLGRGTKSFFDGEVGALPRVLEVYMGKVV